MKRCLLIATYVLVGMVAHAQTSVLDSFEHQIAWFSDIMANAEGDEHRQTAKDRLEETFALFTATSGSYHVAIDSIPWIKVLHGDGFRLVTWQCRVAADEFSYGGFIQWPERTTFLRDSRPFINGSLRSLFSSSGWYGCLYYDIVPFEKDKQTYYLLLGFHAENAVLNTKLADVLDLNGPEPRLGLPVFTGKGEPQTRLIMTYADVSSAHMRYDPALKGIVHDHLESLMGIGPNGESLPVSDGSLEGWLLKKGEWIYTEEVYDVKSKEPPMTHDRKDRKEDKDILGRPRNQ